MNIEDRQFYRQNLKRLRGRNGKRPRKQETRDALKAMIKLRELIKPAQDKPKENFKPQVTQPQGIGAILHNLTTRQE